MADLEKDLNPEEQVDNAVASFDTVNVDGESEDFDLSEFAMDEIMPQEEISISEDLSGFAKGFPDWDLHPPKA